MELYHQTDVCSVLKIPSYFFTVPYQGHLTDSGGAPINGTPDLKFGIYATESGVTPIWEEIHNNVPITNGYFTVLLGSITPLSTATFGDTTRWLQVSVDTGSGYSDLPRQQLTAAPFALQAANADTLDGKHENAFFDLSQSETVSGIPAFNGGTSGSTAPFAVDSNYAVSNLNADLLDGQHASAFAGVSHNHPVLGCRVIRTTAQNIPTRTLTALSFTTVIYDTNNCRDAANPTRLYARTAGYYMAGGAVTFSDTEVDSAARVAIAIMLNGVGGTALQANDSHTIAGLAAGPSVSTGMFYMNPNDYIELYVWHSFNTAKNTYASTQHHVNGWLVKINQ